MGCAGSKHALRGGVRGRAGALRARSYSGTAAGVARHTVALRSTTLGSLSLDRAAAAAAGGSEEMMKSRNDGGAAKGKRGRLAPRTPTKTPLREPEVINVWELMEGLEDYDDGGGDGFLGVKRQALSDSGSPEFDPDILAAFRKALDALSPPRDAPDNGESIKKREIQMFPGIVRSRVNAFQQKINAKMAKMAPRPPRPPESAGRVVVYLTSLRGIRKTYEDCWATKAILHGYGVRVDERDLSMHAGYKEELRAALGGPGELPQVFADGEHLGGAEEVRCMHESGVLAKALEPCQTAPGTGAKDIAPEACGGCGGMRFVPCEACSGSCKVFVEDDESAAGAFRRCGECNENGLVRCPLCCL